MREVRLTEQTEQEAWAEIDEVGALNHSAATGRNL